MSGGGGGRQSTGPVKVARIIARLNLGGPARHCLLLGEGLRARGYETLLLTGELAPGEAPLEAEAPSPAPAGAAGADLPPFRMERIPGLGRAPSPRDDARALRHLVRVLRRERPAIVHTHTAKAGALGRLAARLAGVPAVIHTFHGHVLAGYFSAPGSLAARLAERGLARLTDRIVTLSPALRDELAGRYRVGRREQYALVPLGRDLAPFRTAARGALRGELGLPPDALVVVGVGRLVAIKDVPTLVRAFARLRAQLPAAHLVLVGDGEERGAVEEAVRVEGVAEAVHLLGWRRDLPAILADADLLALSSRNEGTPLAIVEAFAAGVPVVATQVGGVPDMFTRRTGPPVRGSFLPCAEGVLVAPGCPAALGHGMQWLAEDPERLRLAGEAARAACARWDAPRLLDDVAALYAEVLAEKGLSAPRPYHGPP